MEVHKHPHHVTHNKKWTEYVLEFLMLFLAVFLGFVAENIREERVNHTKEKEYMKSMLQDLSADTSTLNTALIFTTRIGNGLDSFSKSLYLANSSDSSTMTIYKLHESYSRAFGVPFNDQTSIQLRNSGGMQVIRNAVVRVAIAEYWKGITVVDNILDRLNNSSDADFANSIFNRSYEHFTVDSVSDMSIATIDPGARLMTNDKNQLINYANRMSRKVAIINNFFLRSLRNQKKAAVDLIALIKKEYQLH